MSGFEMFCERCGKRYGNEETTTVRPCPHCELPVSAKARFCRRCGSAPS
ncbi:MAG: double zinc ribbon domain-containing protein [Candidatus Limnocylindrales bacterium]